MTEYAVDLTKTHGYRQYGDIYAIFTWVGKDKEPAIVLAPTRKIGVSRDYQPCVVPMGSAHKWAEETGYEREAFFMASAFASSLGFNPFDTNRIVRIMSVVRDCMDDLLKIPPMPVTDRIVVADAIRTDQYGKQHHTEITEDV